MNEFAAIIEMRRQRAERFGAYGSWLSRIDPTSSSSIFGRGVASVAAPVAHVVRDYAIRPAIATSAAVMTGGVSVIAGQRIGGGARATFGVRPTAIGFAEGAAIGLGAAAITYAPAALTAAGVKIGGTAAAIVASTGAAAALKAAGVTPTATTGTPSGSSGTPVGTVVPTGDGATPNRAAVLAGLALGFVAGGPVGAVVGGVTGAIIAARRQS